MEHWDQATIEAFRATLLTWYDQAGRKHLPWRQDQAPYRVMVSEIMLQQTQVETVIPYFNRFMAALPTVEALANAPEAQVLKLWEGLGYYSRARNLQKAAKYVVEQLDNQWPRTSATLQALPGIGPYTAAAISSISFGEVVPAIDGNQYRVFSRLLKIDADIAQAKSRQIFYDAIAPIVDPKRPGDFNQAIMDLGTSYMTAKNPDTINSPVRQFNAAYRDHVEANYPVKTPKAKPVKQLFVAEVIENEGRLLMAKRPATGLLADFWTFPLQEISTIEAIAGEQLTIKPVVHVFTHRRWEIWLVRRQQRGLQANEKMMSRDELQALSLPKVQHKLMDVLDSLDLDAN
ncbi:A/G-specific adenine glycosylase [Weissella diestrammenae]|uniref:Adenine DNA glycosylase n=1 Tax=Weissella diestrammenae TaxID=1162633 RepID=A0A7G9T3K5_9LACO|nr:A/G-specific adenine glycosylase [Weissella diestrammenae]MCM0582652.1 A/G-specific adenine glycosylase [Weissella diestrammenae]QNN74680.1 A/G-specific adenine glycosylase [Weissella diestrammenae]